MATATPHWGYRPANPELYWPSENEVMAYAKVVEEITGIKTTPDFQLKVERLIDLVRYNIDVDRGPSQIEKRAEIKQLKLAVSKIQELLNEKKLSYYGHHSLHYAISQIKNREGSTDKLDSLTCFETQAAPLLEACGMVEKELRRGRPLHLREVKHLVAEELARQLMLMGFKPTKTRNGGFDRCLKALAKAVNCEIDGRKIYWPLSDTYPLIRAAVDNYPTGHPIK
ncbi:MAG TPA: hypothetical protein VHP58_00960 [Alphaproteobacteria bacterium]|nr:hypothetical protein [Alphaproteobacteria bacterium]